MLNFLINIISSNNIQPILFIIEIFAFLVKAYVLFFLFLKTFWSAKVPKPLLCLFGILIGGLFVDLAWIIKLAREVLSSNFDYTITLFFIRLGWACNLLVFQLLGCFVEILGEKDYKLKLNQKLLISLNSIFVFYFLYVAIFHFNLIHEQRTWLEWKAINFCGIYWLQLLILPSIYFVYKKIRTKDFPKILKKQLTVLITYLIFPFLSVQLVESFFIWTKVHAYLVATISSPLLTIAICYCIRRIMGLRFLNFQGQVQSPEKFDFIIEFKRFLEDLGHVTSFNEMGHIIHRLFKDTFDVSPNKVGFYTRKNEFMHSMHQESPALSTREELVENMLANNENMLDAMKKYKIFIKDELVFTNFYQESKKYATIIEFLDKVQADVFLPIFAKNILVGYIIIECNARENRFFSDVEHDELVVVAGYLGKSITLLQYSDINAVLAREKELSEEVYHQHRQITQYQESMSTFIRSDKQRKIGVLFYKYRRFVFANQAAQEIITININMHDGHPLTQALKRIAQAVENYKSTQTAFTHDTQGNKIVILGIPNLERNNVIVIVYYPEISDVLRQQMDAVGSPTDWHYVLCLETTQSGQLINHMLPGSGVHMMRFKIDLLRMAMSKKALLLDMPHDDVLPTVEIVHYISLRKALYRLTVDSKAVMSNVAVKLFGINPLYDAAPLKDEEGNVQKSLFEQLSDSGTLFIENIHLLDLEIQNMLAEYLKYGHYCMYKSNHKLFSSVRIICSSVHDLNVLVQEGKFSKNLFDELKETKLTLPPLTSWSEEELQELITGFAEQAVSDSPLKNLLELSADEKNKMFQDRPVSLQGFKNKVKNALIKKSQKREIYHEIKFESAYAISDPELLHAAKLGKKALKDPKILAMLLRKLKTQSKVANFLGVNRSSINRRLQDYKLI